MAVHCGTTGKQKLRKSPATHLVEFGGGGAFEPGIFTRRQPASGGHCAGSIQTLIRGRKMSHEAGGWRCDFIVRKPAAGRPASAIRRPRNRRRAEGSGAPQFSGHVRSRALLAAITAHASDSACSRSPAPSTGGRGRSSPSPGCPRSRAGSPAAPAGATTTRNAAARPAA